MKSSPKPVQPWQPAALSAQPPQPEWQAYRAQMRSLFGENPKPLAASAASPLRRGAQTSGFAAWQPEAVCAPVKEAPASPPPPWQWTESPAPGNSSLPFAAPAPVTEQETAALLQEARTQAQEILLAAQTQADEILQQAEEEILAQRTLAQKQGLEQAQEQLRQTLQAATSLLAQTEAWKQNLLQEAEPILVEMLKQIAQKMFSEGVELDTNALQVNLNRVMENAHGLGSLNIFLHPQDAKQLDPSWSEYQSLVSGGRVKVVPSGKITRGGCFVQGDMGIVDGRVETQLEAVLAVLDNPGEWTG